MSPTGDETDRDTHTTMPPSPRFVCASLDPADLSGPTVIDGGPTVVLNSAESAHAVRVLRLSAGDTVGLLDGKGRAGWAVIQTTDPKCVVCEVHRVEEVPAPRPRLTLATAIPKGPRGDAMVGGLAQLGVDTLVPLLTERSVVHPRDAKLDRYRKAGIEAAKQSGRAWFMDIKPATPLDRMLSDDAALKLIADPRGGDAGTWIDTLCTAERAVVLVGPEGGFTDEEGAAARDAGFVPWCFSSQVLRIETAAAAAVAVLRSMR